MSLFAIWDHSVVHCFVTAALWKILHLSCSSEVVMRLDLQIFLKSTPPNLISWIRPCGGRLWACCNLVVLEASLFQLIKRPSPVSSSKVCFSNMFRCTQQLTRNVWWAGLLQGVIEVTLGRLRSYFRAGIYYHGPHELWNVAVMPQKLMFHLAILLLSSKGKLGENYVRARERLLWLTV